MNFKHYNLTIQMHLFLENWTVLFTVGHKNGRWFRRQNARSWDLCSVMTVNSG